MRSKLVFVLVLLSALEMTSASFISDAKRLSKQISRVSSLPELNLLKDRLSTLAAVENLSAKDAALVVLLKKAFEHRLAELTPAATTTVVPAAVTSTTRRPVTVTFTAPVITVVNAAQSVKTSTVSSTPPTSLAPMTTTVAPATTTTMPSTSTTTTVAPTTTTVTALTTTTKVTALKSNKMMRNSPPVTSRSPVTSASFSVRNPDFIISTTSSSVVLKQSPKVDALGNNSRPSARSLPLRPSAPSPASSIGNHIEVPRAITSPVASADQLLKVKTNAQNGAEANATFLYWCIGMLTLAIVVMATLASVGFGLLYKRKSHSDVLSRADIIKVRNFLRAFEPERLARLAQEGAAAQTSKQPISRPSQVANSEDFISLRVECTPRETARLSLEDIVSTHHGEIYGTNSSQSPTDTQTSTSSKRSWVFRRPIVDVTETAL